MPNLLELRDDWLRRKAERGQPVTRERLARLRPEPAVAARVTATAGRGTGPSVREQIEPHATRAIAKVRAIMAGRPGPDGGNAA